MKRISKQVMAGNVKIGGGAPVTVQSMLNVPSTDIEGSVRQAVALEKAGCQILRAAIPDMDAVRLIPAIKEKISIPLVADIHFDYKLALEAAAAGVDKIRINPGNIGGDDRVKAVATVCREKKIPIRRVSSQSTARPQRKRCAKAHFTTRLCSKSSISRTSSSP